MKFWICKTLQCMVFLMIFCFGCARTVDSGNPYLYNYQIQEASKFGQDTAALRTYLSPLIAPDSSHDVETKQIIFNTLYAKSVFLAKKSINNESNAYFEQAISLANKENNTAMIIWVNMAIGQYYYYFSELERSLPYFLKAAFLINQVPANLQVDAAESYQYLSYLFDTLGEKEKALDYLNSALKLTSDTSKLLPVLLDNIGVNYMERKDTANAFVYLQKAEEKALLLNNISRLAKVKGNFSRIYYNKGDFNKSNSYLEDDIKFSLIAKDSVNLLFAKRLKTRNLLKLGRYPEAHLELKDIDQLVKEFAHLDYDLSEIEELRLNLAILEGKSEEELKVGRALYKMTKENSYKESEDAVVRSRLLLNKEIYQNKLEMANVQLAKAKFSKTMYFILAALLCIITFLWYFYSKRISRARIERYERKVLQFQLEKALLDQKLSDANTTVNDYLKYMSEKNEQIEDLQSVIEKINHSKSAHIEEKNGKLKQVLKSHLLTEENWIRFKQAFEKQYPKYYGSFKRKFPDLTENNLKFVLLQKLGLSSSEISNILGITMDAVKKSKQRLKKRLGDGYDEIIELI